MPDRSPVIDRHRKQKGRPLASANCATLSAIYNFYLNEERWGRMSVRIAAGVLQPFSGDAKLPPQKRTQLDKLYQQVTGDLGKLMDAIALKTA